jgi:predicted enzyme related to lactoylglutathione lyase
MGNAVVHFEIGGPDDQLLVDFYGELFGWNLQPIAGSGYSMIDTCGGGGIKGGIGKSQTGEPWSTFYVEAGDPQALLDKAESLGAKVIMPVTDFGGTVTFAMFNDPDGLLVGLVKSAPPAEQGDVAAPSAGAGAAVDWFEVLGSDAAATQRFYADLFGWTVDNSSFPGYVTVDPGTGRGIQGGLGGGVQARWATVYAAVTDVDQTLDRAEKLGGSRLIDPGVSALKNAARAALYGSADDIKTGAFRDPAGNIFGIYHKAVQ